MPLFSTIDLVALAWFLGAWAIYSITLSLTEKRRQGLNSEMNRYRDVWMFQMLGRDMRMVDAQIVAALQNGTAFFASTSLIAIGGALTLLRSTDEILQVVAALPFGITTTPVQWEAKTMGLAVIFVYAFFKFGWSYRLYNYVAIMVGATPPAKDKDTPEAKGPCRARRTIVRSRRPPLQPRPARVLLRARLSRLVHQPVAVDGDERRGRGGAVAAPVRVGFAARAVR